MGINDANLYDKAYFLKRGYGVDKLRDRMYEQERGRIFKYITCGTVLDIGCGIGEFLSGFDNRWTKYGYDPSKYAQREAAKKRIIIVENLSSLISGGMDIVVLRGVLQHMSTPLETLEQAARILKPNGLLVILATPNADSLVYQTFGTLPALDPKRNWIVFGQRSLDNVLSRLGFTYRQWNFPYWGTPYAHPIRDFIKFGVDLLVGYKYKFAFPRSMMECYCKRKDYQ